MNKNRKSEVKNKFKIQLLSLCMCVMHIITLNASVVYAGTDVSVAEDMPVGYVRTDVSVTGDVMDDPPQESDALYEQYLSTLFYGEPSRNRLRSTSYLNAGMNAHEWGLYQALKEQIKQVAAGKITDTVFTIKDADYLRFTPEELDLEYTGRDNQSEWMAAIEQRLDYDKVWRCLVADCPYELYWHLKTEGIWLNEYKYKYYRDGTGARIETITIWFAVDRKYAATGENGEQLKYKTNLSEDENLQRAVNAANTAKAIVASNQNETDYNKLYNYMREICDRNVYNDAAAADDPVVLKTQGIDPWQLIYVFDGDPDTNVVCEGYAKAFSYLCDLTSFNSPRIACYIVDGPMDGGTGAGDGHMWNVVTMDDGNNYLVDVTNCDDDAIGAPDQLFLAALPGSADTEYTFTTEDGDTTTFAYYPVKKKMYGTGPDSILTLKETETCTVYRPADDPVASVTIGDHTTEYTNIRQTLDAADGEKATIMLNKNVSTIGVALSGDITIDLNGHIWTNQKKDMYFEKLMVADFSTEELAKQGCLRTQDDGTQNVRTLNVMTEYSQNGGLVFADVYVPEGCDTYISNGYLNGLSVDDGAEVLLVGGAFGKITTLYPQTLGDLLGVGYAYAKFEDWTTETGWMLGDEVLNDQMAECVVVRKAPIQSVEVSGNTLIEVDGSTDLTANVIPPEGVTGDINYLWESVDEDGTTTSEAGNGKTLNVSDKAMGSYKYRVTATLNNYAVTREVIVSVGKKPVSITPSAIQAYPTEYVYGQTVVPPTAANYEITGSDGTDGLNVSFSWYQGDFTVANAALPANKKLAANDVPTAVGKYTLIATASGESYAPAECRTLVTIEKADLSEAQLTGLVTVPANKPYDRSGCKAIVNNANKVTGAGSVTIYYAPSGGSSDSESAPAAGSISYTKTAPIAAGSYDVYVDVAEGASYLAVTKAKAGSFTIAKADPDIVLGNLSQTQGKTSAVTVELRPASADATATVEYKVKDVKASADVWTADMPSKAGSYEVRAYLSSEKAGRNLVGYADFAAAQTVGKAVTGTLVISEKSASSGGDATEETPGSTTGGTTGDNSGGSSGSTTGGSAGSSDSGTGTASGDKKTEGEKKEDKDKKPDGDQKPEDSKAVVDTRTVVIDTDTDSKITVTVKTFEDGAKAADAAVTKEISGTKTVITADLADQIAKAVGTDNVTVTTTAKNEAGKTLYKVRVNASDLKAGKALYIYQKNKDGSYVAVNAKKYTVSKSGAVSVSMEKKATYELVGKAKADEIKQEILVSVKPAAKSKTLSVGKTAQFAFAKGFDAANIKSVTYKTGNASVATVSKSGKIKSTGKGTVVIKAIVTLKDGSKKTIRMKVKGK